MAPIDDRGSPRWAGPEHVRTVTAVADRSRSRPGGTPMTAYEPQPSQLHSPAWVAITKIQFAISVLALVIGLAYLPVEPWIVPYLVMGTLLLTSSTVALPHLGRAQCRARGCRYV